MSNDNANQEQPIREPIVINKANNTMSDKWLRLLFMLLFVLCHYVVRIIIYLLAAVQFIVVLATDKPNENLLIFGQSLSYYAYQILRFLSYNSEEKPFPFGPWPTNKM